LDVNPDTLKLITDLTPFGTVLVTVVGAVWIALTYFQSQKDARIARTFESRKPFLEHQLKLYTETAQVAGKLAVAPIGEDDFKKALYRFWELYWSELAVVEDERVELAMEKVGEALAKMENTGAPRSVLEDSVLDLAHALHDGIIDEWGAHMGARMKRIATARKN
jgi:hypothetical protein